MRVLIAGDFCQTNRLDNLIQTRQYAAIFDNIIPFIKSSHYSIVNFEFPIVKDPIAHDPIPKCGPNLKGTIEAVEAIRYCGFNCCTLANNHILDYGCECALDTAFHLRQAGMDVVGFGKDKVEAEKTLYTEINGQRLAIINCCEHEFSIASYTQAGCNPLNPIAQYYAIKEAKEKSDYVLVIIHGGHEHFQLPSPRMVETYRFFIDSGADAVVNHHQHCYSGYEVYNNKPIFYGLGNFLFDGNRAGGKISWNEGCLLTLDFSNASVNFKLTPYIQCLSSPGLSLMNDDEEIIFNQRIDKLNTIISNTQELEKAVNKYYESSTQSELINIEPYSGRVLRKLLYMGFLPRFIKGEKLLTILNRISCESHRDKIIYALNRMIEQ